MRQVGRVVEVGSRSEVETTEGLADSDEVIVFDAKDWQIIPAGET